MENCLTYLLRLWGEGHRFKILYDGNHCIGVNNKKIFDLNNQFKEDLLLGYANRYTDIKVWHSLETIIKIFNLTEENKELITEYYE